MSGLHEGNNMLDKDGNSFLDISNELSDMFLQVNPPKPDDPDQVAKAREWRKKRSRSELHNLVEKRRREKIRERIEILHQLMPNFKNIKTDRASILDNAVEYIKTLYSYVNRGTSGHNYEGVIPDQSILPIGPDMENYNGVILDQPSLLIRPNIHHYQNAEIVKNQPFLPIGPNMENLGPMDYYSPPHPNPMITFPVHGYPESTMIPPSNVQVPREMINSMFFSSEQLFTPPISPPSQSSLLFMPPPPPSGLFEDISDD